MRSTPRALVLSTNWCDLRGADVIVSARTERGLTSSVGVNAGGR
jgi:hypothetical protein